MKKRRLEMLRERRKRLPGGGMKLQILRRALQLSVLAMLVVVPVLSLYDNLQNQRATASIKARVDTALVDRLVGDSARAAELTSAVRGSVWTAKIGDTVISDPLATLDLAAAARRPLDAFWLTALIPLALTLLLGRVFCGWLCPADVLFEMASTVRRWIGIETDVKFPRGLKFAVLGVGTVAGALAGMQVFADIYPPRVLGGELYALVTYGVLGAGAWLLLTIVAFEIFVSRRFWCRYVCPGGALYSLIGSQRLVRITLDRDKCTDCNRCQPVCEFGLDPTAEELGPECNNCGLCIRACAPGALTIQLRRARRQKREDAA